MGNADIVATLRQQQSHHFRPIVMIVGNQDALLDVSRVLTVSSVLTD